MVDYGTQYMDSKWHKKMKKHINIWNPGECIQFIPVDFVLLIFHIKIFKYIFEDKDLGGSGNKSRLEIQIRTSLSWWYKVYKRIKKKCTHAEEIKTTFIFERYTLARFCESRALFLFSRSLFLNMPSSE